MRKLLIAVGLIAGVAAISGYVWYTDPVQTTQRAVLANLVDPDSAKFENVYFNPATGAGCGWVNAKNKMGGYAGFTVFILEKDGTFHLQPPDANPADSTQERLKSVQKSLAFMELGKSICGLPKG